MNSTNSAPTPLLPAVLFDAAGFAIDHVDSFLVVVVLISAICFVALLLDNDDGWCVPYRTTAPSLLPSSAAPSRS